MNVHYYATVNQTHDKDRLYINGLDIHGDDEKCELVNVVELSPVIYLELYRRLGRRIRVGHVYSCRYFVARDAKYIDNMDQIGVDNENINATEYDIVDVAAERIAMTLREWIASTTQLVPLMLFQYMRANLTLQAANIFITDDNKEEKYLEIISKGDDKLIDALSDFLDAQDELIAKTHVLQVYQKSVDALNKAKTVQQVEEIYKQEIAPEIMRTAR